MKLFQAALWAETLKARRSKVSLLTAIGFAILPLAGGLFMVILKDPERARAMGLISLKAQIVAGVADWSSFFGILTQGTAIGGAVLYAIITAWVFGREFSDHTVKELLGLPTPRASIVGAKFILIAFWTLGLTLLIFLVGLGVGALVRIPGWSPGLVWQAFWSLMTTALLTYMLMPFVALFASVGRGYLAPLGWAFFTLVFAQIVSVLGWGDWIPWAVPALFSGMAGPPAEQTGLHSYLLVLLAFVLGELATIVWWQRADQAG